MSRSIRTLLLVCASVLCTVDAPCHADFEIVPEGDLRAVSWLINSGFHGVDGFGFEAGIVDDPSPWSQHLDFPFGSHDDLFLNPVVDHNSTLSPTEFSASVYTYSLVEPNASLAGTTVDVEVWAESVMLVDFEVDSETDVVWSSNFFANSSKLGFARYEYSLVDSSSNVLLDESDDLFGFAGGGIGGEVHLVPDTTYTLTAYWGSTVNVAAIGDPAMSEFSEMTTAFSFQAVPAPGSLCILACGSLAATRRRRRA